MSVNKKVVEIDTLQAVTSVKDLKQLLKDLRTTMLNTAEGTEEYNDALTLAAEISHQLSEQTRLIKNSAADFGQIMSNTTSVMGGIVASFQAANATMNLFGVENEDVIKSLEKMQNLMAMTQALPALDKAYKGFLNLRTVIMTATGATSAFGKALITTGLGALVVALGYAVSHFEEISKWLDELTGQTDFLGTVADAVMGGINAGWTAIITTLKAVGKAIVTYVTTPFKSIVAAIQAFTSTKGGMGDKLKAAAKAMKNNFVSDWKGVGNDFKKIGTETATAYQEGFDKNHKKRLESAKKKGKEEGTAKGKAKAEAEEAAYKKRLRDIDTEEREEMLKLQAMGLNYEEYVKQKEALEDAFTKKRIENIQNILATETKLSEKEIADLQGLLISLQDSLYKAPEKEKEEKKKKDEESPEEKKLKIIKSSVNELATLMNNVSENPAWGNMITTLTSIGDIFIDLQKKQAEFGKGSVDYAKAATNAYMQVAAVGFDAMSQMFQGIADEQDTSNKEGFETAKKMQIASATMTTLSSVLQALAGGNSMASQLGLAAPIGWAMGAAMAAMVGAMGAANIAKIAQTKFNGSPSTSGSTPRASAISSITAPVQYTQDVQGASIEGSIKDTRVVVTEGDITNTQKKVYVAQSENRY